MGTLIFTEQMSMRFAHSLIKFIHIRVEHYKNWFLRIFFLQTVPISNLASLPPAFISDKPYAHQYGLALAVLPPEEDDKLEAVKNFAQDALNRDLLLNVEYK